MADNMKNAGDAPEVALDLDDPMSDLESVMRDAVAAVEGVESGARHDSTAAGGGDAIGVALRARPAFGEQSSHVSSFAKSVGGSPTNIRCSIFSITQRYRE